MKFHMWSPIMISNKGVCVLTLEGGYTVVLKVPYVLPHTRPCSIVRPGTRKRTTP